MGSEVLCRFALDMAAETTQTFLHVGGVANLPKLSVRDDGNPCLALKPDSFIDGILNCGLELVLVKRFALFLCQKKGRKFLAAGKASDMCGFNRHDRVSLKSQVK